MNKPDKFEKFVKDHRDEFDSLEPSPALWKAISEKQTQTPIKKINWIGIMWKAAACIAIFILSYYVNDFIRNQKEQIPAMVVNNPIVEKPINMAIADTIVINKGIENVGEENEKRNNSSIASKTGIDKKVINATNKKKTKKAALPVYKELNEAHIYYAAMIDNKKKEIFRFAKCNPGLEKDVRYEITEMDSIYSDLQRDLKDNIDNEKVIDAIIQSYRVKLEILEDMLLQLKQATKRNNPCVEI